MHYSDIPDEIKLYLEITEEEFDALPLSVRRLVLENAEERYRDDIADEDVESEDFPIGNFEITVKEGKRVLKCRGRKYKWMVRDVIGEAADPVVLTPANIGDFGRALDELRDEYISDGFTPSQYILKGNGCYDNTSPNSSHLMSLIQVRLEEYDEGRYVVDGFTIRFKKGYNRGDHHGGITAGKGEGVPRDLGNGYWVLDIVQSNNKCIPNAYTLWTMYRDGCVDQTIQGQRGEFNSRRRHLPSGDGIKFRDVMKSHEAMDIVYDDRIIPPMSPKNTITVCHFVYTNGHVGLLVHEEFLEDKSISALKKLAERTVLHRIRSKEVDDSPIHIVTADIESFRRLMSPGTGIVHEHEPLLIGQYDGKKFVHFRGENALEEYCQYLSDADKNWLIWFHNGGRYDVHFLFSPILKLCDADLDYPADLRDLRGNLLEVRAHLSNGRTVTFRDSCSLIPGSLAGLAKDMGVTRKMEDIDIKNVSREDMLTSKKILEYNKKDCISLHEVLTKYQSTSTKTFGTNPLHHVSASSFAKKIFFSQYYDEEEYPLYVFPKKVRDFIAGAYSGGRNEVFHRGRFSGIPIFPYDFSAFYPSVGVKLIPYGVPKWKDNLHTIKGKDAIKKFLEENPGFYEVEILSSPRNKIPLHGILHKHRYVFPHFVNCNTKIFSMELLLGLEIGYRYRLLRGYTQPLAPICAKFFKRLVKVRAKAKRKGQPVLEKAAKVTGSAGYGHFGFNPYNRNVLRMYGENMVEHLESLADNAKLSYRKEGDTYLCYERTDILLPDINVSVAAAITSHARMKLWELMQDITDAGGKIYYCDTDSVYSSIDIQEHPTLGPKWCGVGNGANMGELKRELPKGENISDVVLVGCKTYAYTTNKGKYHVKSKGTNNPKPMYEPKMDDEKYDDPYENYDKDVEEYARNKDMFGKLCMLLTSDQVFDTDAMRTSRMHKVGKDMKIYDEVVPKKITGVYTKGHVLEDGRIIPLKLTSKPIVDNSLCAFLVKQMEKEDRQSNVYENE